MKHFKEKPPISLTQRTIGAALLAGLVLIVAVILIIQSHYEPTRWQMSTTDGLQGSTSSPATPSNAATEGDNGLKDDTPALQVWDRVAGLAPLGTAERYDAITLSDKINGKAELYLSAGFQELETRRFAFSDQPGIWLERYIYSMATHNDAFSVFSRQRRPGSTAAFITPDAYRSANGLFLVQGPYYLELIASDTSDALWPPMEALAAAFVDHHPVSQSHRDETTVFPRNGLVADSISLTTANAFGFSRLDQVYSADYQWQNQAATAFVSLRANPAEAQALARAYVDFLIEYDARALADPRLDGQIHLLDVFGTFEIVFHQGAYLAGVHEAEDLERAMALARQLKDNLTGAAK